MEIVANKLGWKAPDDLINKEILEDTWIFGISLLILMISVSSVTSICSVFAVFDGLATY